MTKEEALRILDTIPTKGDEVDALEMAIEALEQKVDVSTNTLDIPTDTISRQAAMDAFGLSEKTRKYGGDHSGYDTMMLYEIQDILEDLPPCNEVMLYNKGFLDGYKMAIDYFERMRKING